MAERNNRSAMIKKLKFLKDYSKLRSELLQDQAFEYDEQSRQWVGRVLDYFVPRGNLKKGMSVIESYRFLRVGKEQKDNEVFLASVLGWCVELLEAYCLAVDVIMDSSHTQSDDPDQFKLSEEGAAIPNDGLFLRSYSERLLTKHFRGKSYYADIYDLFNEAEYRTGIAKMLYVLTNPEGEKNLSKISLPLYRRIVQSKTAFYSFYLPVASALVLSGEQLDSHNDVKNILLEMGVYFQVQDDYLDCYGELKKSGKVGSDIKEFQFSWLVVKALERCNEDQKKVLFDHYGKDNPTDTAKLKALYDELDLQGAFVEYEAKTYKKLMASIESHPSKTIQALLTSFMSKAYNRLN